MKTNYTPTFSHQDKLGGFPNDKFATILNKVNIKHKSEYSQQEVKRVFIQTIKEYIDKNITLDDLSYIANNFSQDALYENWKDEELSTTVMLAADLSYYLRSADKDTLKGKINALLEYVED